MSTSPRRQNILLVESEEEEVFTFKNAVRAAKIDQLIFRVKSGEDAIAYLSNKGKYASKRDLPLPSLILLDLKLPGISGFEVIQWIRGQPTLSLLRVVVLTAYQRKADIDKAYDLGANSYVVKRTRFEDLVYILKTLHLYWLGLNIPPEVSAG